MTIGTSCDILIATLGKEHFVNRLFVIAMSIVLVVGCKSTITACGTSWGMKSAISS